MHSPVGFFLHIDGFCGTHAARYFQGFIGDIHCKDFRRAVDTGGRDRQAANRSAAAYQNALVEEGSTASDTVESD